MARRTPFWHDARIKHGHDIACLRPASLNRGQRFETVLDAADYSTDIQAALSKRPGRPNIMATVLSECADGDYVCTKPLCPICARGYRRWLTSELLRIAEDQLANARIRTVFLASYQVGQLMNANIAKSHDILRKRLQRSEFSQSTLIGGTELSYNANRSEWILHVHLLAIGVTDRAVGMLKDKFKGKLAQPVRSQPLRDLPKQLSYLQKFVTFH